MSLALVLPEGAVSGSDAVTFPGFPGVWTPGQPIELSAFAAAGIASADELLELAAEMGVPLEEVDVDEGSAPLPERENHLTPSAPSAPLNEGLAAKTVAELDELAAEMGLEDYPKSGKKPEKLAAIEAALAAEPDEAEDEAPAEEDEG